MEFKVPIYNNKNLSIQLNSPDIILKHIKTGGLYKYKGICDVITLEKFRTKTGITFFAYSADRLSKSSDGKDIPLRYSVTTNKFKSYAASDEDSIKFKNAIIYQSLKDGKIWVRNQVDFLDGRFQAIKINNTNLNFKYKSSQMLEIIYEVPFENYTPEIFQLKSSYISQIGKLLYWNDNEITLDCSKQYSSNIITIAYEKIIQVFKI